MFEHTSRYYKLETTTLTTTEGRTIVYKRRRFLPRSDRLTTLSEAVVLDGERLDLLTARALGEPEAYWQVCDANDAMHPAELTAEPGRTLRIPIPQF